MHKTTVFTIGYRDSRTGYPRAIGEFLGLLEHYAITLVADVRWTTRGGFGRSEYSRKALSAHLTRRGIRYEHFRELGNADRGDAAIARFRAAMAEEEESRLARLLERIGPSEQEAAQGPRVALVCACAQPHVCHRGVIADALELRGYDVVHITGIPAPEF